MLLGALPKAVATLKPSPTPLPSLGQGGWCFLGAPWAVGIPLCNVVGVRPPGSPIT